MTFQKGYPLKIRYEVKELISHGEMSEVYLALDRGAAYNSVVAKHLIFSSDKDEIKNFVQCFEQEYSVLLSLDHPQIPKVYDFFQEEDEFYLVEEYIKGDLLANEINGLLPRQAIKFVLQLCDILEYLHSRDIAYRDIKPDNIIVGDDGKVYLIDFGISRIYSPLKKSDTVALGTPDYAPPECCNPDQTDQRTDIYCLCVLLHQMLTKLEPKASDFKFKPPHLIDKHISKEISDIVMKGLSSKPEERFQNIAELREALLSTKEMQNKFKSYSHDMEARERFFKNEEPIWEFSKFRNEATKACALSITTGIILSAIIAAVTLIFSEPWNFIPAVGVFIALNAIFLIVWKLRQKGVRKISIFNSGLLYEGTDKVIQSIWKDIYAMKIDSKGSCKKVQVITLNGDFDFDENLQGWDQVMKTIKRNARLKPRQIPVADEEHLEVYEK